MDAIRIENLRSLTDTGFVELKPLTLLVGQNSSGKSSFLRFFPLLRQSVEARAEGPISWYGRLVDFGSFQEALGRKNEKQEISFHFRLTLEESVPIIRGDPKSEDVFENITFVSNEPDIRLTLRLGRDRTEDGTLTKTCLLSYADHQVKIEFDKDRKVTAFQVNTLDVLENMNLELYDEKTGHFLPRINVSRTDVAARQIMRFKNFRENLSDLPVSDDNKSLRDRIIMLAELLEELDTYFDIFVPNIRYIAPVRATAERYYRVQNLALGEVDSRGQNLAMFLKNLTPAEQKDFENWTREHFGFILSAVSSGGHISLNMKDLAEGEAFNLADTGFGYSQILPVLIQLWSLIAEGDDYRNHFIRRPLRSKTASFPVIFAIEQPELHLHPGLQARLADVFIAVTELAKAEEIDLRLIIETHSEVIISRIGHRIANRNLNPEDVNVVLFEKEPSAVSTKVSFSKYDENGFLINWPLGFLEPEMI